jgi:hypothetical protein
LVSIRHPPLRLRQPLRRALIKAKLTERIAQKRLALSPERVVFKLRLNLRSKALGRAQQRAKRLTPIRRSLMGSHSVEKRSVRLSSSRRETPKYDNMNKLM